MKNLIIKPL